MSCDILVLGADGQQGILSTLFLLSRGYKIACSDIYQETFRKETRGSSVPFSFCDHRDTGQIIKLLRRFRPKMVLNCANDFYNENVCDALLSERVSCVDFGTDIARTQSRLGRFNDFKKAGLTLIMGCGSVPGIGSVMMRHLSGMFERMDSAEAGFAWNSNEPDFVPPFFLYVVTLELSQPVAVMSGGKMQLLPPLHSRRTQEFPMIGEQVVYMVSHSEVFSFHHYFEHLGLKNVRFFAGFPAHSRSVIDALIKLRLNQEEPLTVATETGRVSITPCDFLTAAAKKIETPAGYEESEVLWASVEGVRRGDTEPQIYQMTCLVPPLKGWERFGCNVDTAFPGCIISEMILRGEIADRGVFCPEGIVPTRPFFSKMRGCGFRFLLNGQPFAA